MDPEGLSEHQANVLLGSKVSVGPVALSGFSLAVVSVRMLKEPISVFPEQNFPVIVVYEAHQAAAHCDLPEPDSPTLCFPLMNHIEIINGAERVLWTHKPYRRVSLQVSLTEMLHSQMTGRESERRASSFVAGDGLALSPVLMNSFTRTLSFCRPLSSSTMLST